jgi:hypothetical protein
MGYCPGFAVDGGDRAFGGAGFELRLRFINHAKTLELGENKGRITRMSCPHRRVILPFKRINHLLIAGIINIC